MSQKLKTLKPLVNTLPPRIRAYSDHAVRETNSPWREWYRTSEWQRLRIKTFIADNFTCRMCGVLCRGKAAHTPVCDHIVPHRGNRTMFFDPLNLQTLCKTCHDGPKQRYERKDMSRGG